MNTNHQLVRGNYTAKADSMGAGQIRGSQESLLWDKRTPCCRQTEEEQEKQTPGILAEHLWTENPTQGQNQPPKFKWVIIVGLNP